MTTLPTPGVYLNWMQGTAVLIGLVNTIFQENPCVEGITFPSNSTTPVNVRMSSSSHDLQTFDTFRNVKLYLTGDPDQIAIIQGLWPTQGGGLFISYDGGKTYTPFTTTYGYQADPTTWVLLPAVAVGLGGLNGVLGPFDSANLVLKYVIPEQANQYDIYNVQLTADFDVA
jgi:hypothetical protein